MKEYSVELTKKRHILFKQHIHCNNFIPLLLNSLFLLSIIIMYSNIHKNSQDMQVVALKLS